MKERVLEDDEVIREVDIVYFKDGESMLAKGSIGTPVRTAKQWDDIESRIIKVTREGEKMKEKIKQYPNKFYAQRCMTNPDPTDLSISVNPNDLDMNYPVLEITYSKKKGFKIRQVTITEKRTFVTKEVK